MGAQPPALLTLVNNSIAGDVLLTWLRRGALPCTTGITCFSSFRGAGPHLCPNLSLPSLRHSLISPKHTPPANTRTKKGAPPGAPDCRQSGARTVVLAPFFSVCSNCSPKMIKKSILSSLSYRFFEASLLVFLDSCRQR